METDHSRRRAAYDSQHRHGNRDQARKARLSQLKEWAVAGTISVKHNQELARLAGKQRSVDALERRRIKKNRMRARARRAAQAKLISH